MLTINFNPFPVIESPRLILRRPVAADIDELFKYRSDKELMQYIPHRYATSRAQVEETLERIDKLIAANEGINWAITLKGDDTIIGMVGYVHFYKEHYRAEIGYMLHTPYHGQGIAAEATKAAIDYGFGALQLHSIEAIVNSKNAASQKLLQRLGFTNDAFFRDYLCHDGKFMDANVYSLLKPAIM
jgi:ribosomal-protein-alanine N-acetyltransferase